jgi:hypothetical protein
MRGIEKKERQRDRDYGQTTEENNKNAQFTMNKTNKSFTKP